MTDAERELDLQVGDLQREILELQEKVKYYRQANQDLITQNDDYRHNNDLDVQDSRRFQRVVRAALEQDMAFLDSLQEISPVAPTTLEEVRNLIDTAMTAAALRSGKVTV